MSPPLPKSPIPPLLPSEVPDDYDDPGARSIDLTTRPVADSLREIMASSPRLPKPVPPSLPPVGPPYTNRHWTLAVLGLLSLLSAFVLAGESVWRLVAGGLDGLAQDQLERARLLVENPVSILFLLVIGVGLIFARRWARQLSLAFLRQGLLWVLASATAVAINNFPEFSQPLTADNAIPVWHSLLFLGAAAMVTWLLLAVLSHRDVWLTCEAAQLVPDWTDERAPSEVLLFALMISSSTTWAGLAGYHAWPCWGVWRFDLIPWAWGGAAAVAAVAASWVARGRAAGPCLAIGLVAAVGSSVAVTVLRQPTDEARLTRLWGRWDDFSPLWAPWDFNRHGGLAFTTLMAVITVAVAVAALRSQARGRKHSAAKP